MTFESASYTFLTGWSQLSLPNVMRYDRTIQRSIPSTNQLMISRRNATSTLGVEESELFESLAFLGTECDSGRCYENHSLGRLGHLSVEGVGET